MDQDPVDIFKWTAFENLAQNATLLSPDGPCTGEAQCVAWPAAATATYVRVDLSFLEKKKTGGLAQARGAVDAGRVLGDGPPMDDVSIHYTMMVKSRRSHSQQSWSQSRALPCGGRLGACWAPTLACAPLPYQRMTLMTAVWTVRVYCTYVDTQGLGKEGRCNGMLPVHLAISPCRRSASQARPRLCARAQKRD